MTINEIVEHELLRKFNPSGEGYPLARDVALAVAKAVVKECAIIVEKGLSPQCNEARAIRALAGEKEPK
jgi:hypothetical protein